MSTEQQELQTLDQQRQALRDAYEQSIRDFLAVAKERAKKKQIAAFQACHAAGLAYFNAHDRAIPADARLKIDRDPTCYTDRAETSANVLETICRHYRCLRQWGGDLGIDLAVLQPSLTAFANMQRRINNSPTAGCAFGDGATVKADHVHSHQEGDQIMGDKIHVGGNAIGSAIGRRASVKANDIIAQVQQSGMDNDLKEKLAKAAEIIDALEVSEDDKADATDNLAKLSEEMQKEKPEPSRIRRLWNGIKEIAPTAASLLASAVSIAKLLSGTP
jgi:hypothetical protein